MTPLCREPLHRLIPLIAHWGLYDPNVQEPLTFMAQDRQAVIGICTQRHHSTRTRANLCRIGLRYATDFQVCHQ